MRQDAMKLAGVFLLMMVGLVCCCVGGCEGCHDTAADGTDTVSVRVDTMRDTVYKEMRDTVPAEKERRIVRYVPAGEPPGTVEALAGERQDSGMVAVVQKTYTDDSTYTAYVSGVECQEWPRLDSIVVRQREVASRVHEVVTVRQRRKARWTIGITAGPVVDFVHGTAGVGLGAGVAYNF